MLDDSPQKEQGVQTPIDGTYVGTRGQPAGVGSSEAKAGSSQAETSQKKPVEKTPGKTKLAGILGQEMVQKARALDSMAEGRAPEIPREEALSSEAEEIAKSAIYRAISILKSGQITDQHPFIYVKRALEAVYVDKDGNPLQGKDGFDLSSIDPNTEEGGEKIAKAVEKLFSQNPEQAAVLGFRVLTDLRGMISQVFEFEEIKEPENKEKKKKEKKLPSFTELLTACGLEDLMEFDIGPDGNTIVSLKIPEDLTYETYKKIYEQKLKQQLKTTSWRLFFGRQRAKGVLERGNLIKLTEEQFNELKRQAQEAGGKKQIGRIKIKQGAQDDQILSKFLGLAQINEFTSTTDKEKRKVASERLNSVLSDFVNVYNELLVYTGAPPVKGSEFLTKNLAIPGTSITVDAIIGKIQGETKKRLEKEVQKKESEAWRKRIAVRKKEAEANTGKDKEESEEGKKKKERRENALSAVKELIELQPEVETGKKLALGEFQGLIENLPDNIRQLLGGDEAGENLLRIINGESIVGVCGKDALEEFIGKNDNDSAGIRAELKRISDEIEKKQQELKEAREITTESTDSQGKKTKTTTGGSAEERQLIQEEIRELKAELKSLEEIIKGGAKLREYILSQIGIDPKNLDAYPQISSYLQKLRTYKSKEAELDTLLSVLNISKTKTEGDTERSKTLNELRDELKQEAESQKEELLKLTALEEMFKIENGVEEADVLGAVYGRLEETKKSGSKIPKSESDIWKRAKIEADLTEEQVRIIYILFGEPYLRPLENGISTDTIKAIYALIKDKSITNTDDLGNLLDEWETSLLKIAKPGTNRQQAQPIQSQPSSGGVGAGTSPSP